MAGKSNHYDSMVKIKELIEALNLTGLTGGVVIQEVAEYQDGKIPIPFISISPYGAEDVDSQTNYEDGVNYKILVAIMAKPDVNSLEDRLAWRQKLRRSLYNRDLTTLGTGRSYSMSLRMGNVIEPSLYLARKGCVSGFVVIVEFQEPRNP